MVRGVEDFFSFFLFPWRPPEDSRLHLWVLISWRVVCPGQAQCPSHTVCGMRLASSHWQGYLRWGLEQEAGNQSPDLGGIWLRPRSMKEQRRRFALKSCFILLCSFHNFSLTPYGFCRTPWAAVWLPGFLPPRASALRWPWCRGGRPPTQASNISLTLWNQPQGSFKNQRAGFWTNSFLWE